MSGERETTCYEPFDLGVSGSGGFVPFWFRSNILEFAFQRFVLTVQDLGFGVEGFGFKVQGASIPFSLRGEAAFQSLDFGV